MRVNVTFRHMEATEALKEYAQEKVERIKKYFPDPMTAHVVLATERGYQHLANIDITLHNGITIQGSEITEDMYSSIDLVMAKIERQVRRYKDRIRSHKPWEGVQIPVHESILEAASVAPESSVDQSGPTPMAGSGAGSPKVIRSNKFFAKEMSVDEALMQMDLLGNEFLVFMNAATKEVNVVYRRKDGNYGLIETGRELESQIGGDGVPPQEQVRSR